jgi:hypothetical protein
MLSCIFNIGVTLTFQLGGLPFKSLLYTSEDTVIAGGFDCAPILFKEQGGMWYAGAALRTCNAW